MEPNSSSISLYRYRNPSENTFAELADGLGWYSRYDCLNDPFEGSYINLSGEPTFDYLIKSFRVLCLSRTVDNLLMWAHYAQNHQGLCLEYNFTESIFRGQCFPISYSDTKPILEVVRRYPSNVGAAESLAINIDREAKVFLTKSEEWSYEQEYRLMKFTQEPDKNGERSEIPGTLSAIYFGLRASNQLISVVDKLLGHKQDIKFFKAQLIKDKFTLEFKPYPINSMK